MTLEDKGSTPLTHPNFKNFNQNVKKSETLCIIYGMKVSVKISIGQLASNITNIADMLANAHTSLHHLLKSNTPAAKRGQCLKKLMKLAKDLLKTFV